jgi:hypothetical protein
MLSTISKTLSSGNSIRNSSRISRFFTWGKVRGVPDGGYSWKINEVQCRGGDAFPYWKLRYIDKHPISTIYFLWCAVLTRLVRSIIPCLFIRNVCLHFNLKYHKQVYEEYTINVSYIVAVSFIGEGNRSTRRKTPTWNYNFILYSSGIQIYSSKITTKFQSSLAKLKPSLRKFYGRHHDFVNRYGISVSQMTTNMFHLS